MSAKMMAILVVAMMGIAAGGAAIYMLLDNDNTEEDWAIIVKDDAGKEIKLKGPLERVAVVNTNIPTFMKILGLQDKVVGMDHRTLTEKEIATYYSGLVDFGDNKAMNGEKMLDNEVKHVLTPTSMGVGNRDALEALGITVITVECFGETMIDDVDLLLKLFGSRDEQKAAAKKYTDMYHGVVDAILKKAQDKRTAEPSWNPSFLFQMASSKGDPFYTEIAQLSMIVEQIGGHNVVRDLGLVPATKQTIKISDAALIDYDQTTGLDYIFIRGTEGENHTWAYNKFLSLSNLEGWSELSPIKNRNVWYMDTRISSGAMTFIGYACIAEAYDIDTGNNLIGLMEEFNNEFGFDFSTENLSVQLPEISG